MRKHHKNYCLVCDATDGLCNNEKIYKNSLPDSIIDYAPNIPPQFDGITPRRQSINQRSHNSELYKKSTMALNSYENFPTPKIITIDHHTNPFVFKCELNFFRKLMTLIFTIFIVPCRLFIVLSLLMIAWILASIGLWGLTMQDLNVRPISGWRRIIQILTARAVHGMFFFGSFHNVKITGKQATSKEAPILALAPHSSFFDSISVVLFGPASVLAKAETASLPFLGKLINFTQPIYVWREDPNSRQKTIETVIERASSRDDWPQIIIFPEGTCTNRSCLLSFKPGAFYPGVPVQPVCIRYPNKFDTVTWTWEGPGALKLVWLTMCQVYTKVELEFLPVYIPNEEEKNNPKLFAVRVRNVMAKSLGLPVSDLTYDDCKLIIRARQMNLPHSNEIVEIGKLRQKIGLDLTNIEEQVVKSYLVHDTNCVVSMPEFALRLQVSVDDPATADLFRIFDMNVHGEIDFREYLLCSLYLINQSVPTMDLIKIVSKIYDNCGRRPGYLTRTALHKILSQTMALNDVGECIELFTQIDRNRNGFITIDDLELHLKNKPEYAHLFEIPTTAKRTSRSRIPVKTQ